MLETLKNIQYFTTELMIGYNLRKNLTYLKRIYYRLKIIAVLVTAWHRYTNSDQAHIVECISIVFIYFLFHSPTINLRFQLHLFSQLSLIGFNSEYTFL